MTTTSRVLRHSTFVALFVIGTSVPAHGQVRIEKNVVVGMVSGLALMMDVHHPDEPNGHAIVHIQGSGFGRALAYSAQPLSERGFDAWGEPFLAAGFTVFSLNHRAIPRFQWPEPLEDIQRAVRYIRAHADEYGIDPDRIGAYGSSSGGFYALSLGLRDGEGKQDDPDSINRVSAKVQAVVALAAPVDFTRSRGEEVALLMDAWSETDPETEEYQRRRDASPIYHVSVDDPPTLLVHGDADDVVSLEANSARLHAVLDSVGVESELLVVPGSEHSWELRGAADPDAYRAQAVRWFERHLKR